MNLEALQTFQSLGLSEPILAALTDLSFEKPTAIQEETIPALLEQSIDILALAQTGTGKTAAFGLPMIEAINPESPFIQSIVLAPTRELAQQIAEQLKHFSKYMKGVKIGLVYGGAPIQNQIKSIKKDKPQIVVATPGRMIDLIDRKVLNLSNVSLVVLDEADEMLNMGFKEEIDTILSFTQHDKNTWLFSATMPKEIRSIANKYMSDPLEINVKSGGTQVNLDILHGYAMVKRQNKQEALQRILDVEGEMYGLIFCRTKIETQRLATALGDHGYPAEALHGDMTQGQRNAVMKKFKTQRIKLLVSTDVAARGIDVDNLSHVIHYDLPDDLAFYTHRSGRTGRAGKKGIALALLAPGEYGKLKQLEKSLKINFQHYVVPTAEDVKTIAIGNHLERIFEIEASDEARELAHSMSEDLEQISKEELLAKLLTNSIPNESSGQEDLNAQPGKNQKSSSAPNRRGRKRSDGTEENMRSFRINIGKKDQIRTGDLLKIICDATGVRSKYIGRINLQKEVAFFDVQSDKAQRIPESFSGVKYKGRQVKVAAKS